MNFFGHSFNRVYFRWSWRKMWLIFEMYSSLSRWLLRTRSCRLILSDGFGLCLLLCWTTSLSWSCLKRTFFIYRMFYLVPFLYELHLLLQPTLSWWNSRNYQFSNKTSSPTVYPGTISWYKRWTTTLINLV